MTTLSDYNNNPGNLRPPKGVTYEGQIGVDDKGFAIFESKDFGQKALINDVTHKLGKGINTPDKFVDRFAPAGAENDEEARDNYKIFLAQQLGLKSTSDPFPKDAAERLAKAVGQFEGGTWAQAQPEEQPAPQAAPGDQYGTDTVSNIPTGEEKDRAAVEAALMGAGVGTLGGSIYTAKAPIFRMAQRVGLLPGGKPIAPAEAAALAERVMTPAAQPESVVRKPHGGENWQKSLTGISTPGAQMDKASLDLAKRMQGAVGIGGAPGFTGGTITEGGIILSPQDAAAAQAQQQARAAAAAAKAAEQESRIQSLVRQAEQSDAVQRGARTIFGSAPVRGGLAGFGAGYNAQEAYNRFQEGDPLAGTASTGAAGTSVLSLVPRLASRAIPATAALTTASDVSSKLKRGDRQGAAESGLTGLAAVLPRIFGPLGAALYSRGLNAGEQEELERRRKMAPTITP